VYSSAKNMFLGMRVGKTNIGTELWKQKANIVYLVSNDS